MSHSIRHFILGLSLCTGLCNPQTEARANGAEEARQTVVYAGAPAELSLFQISDHTLEIQISPIGPDGEPAQPPHSEILIDYPRAEVWKGRAVAEREAHTIGDLTIEITTGPLSVIIKRTSGEVVQELRWPDDTGSFQFRTEAPVFGLGHGGPQYDRRGHLFPMRDGWGAYRRPTHGSRVSTPMLIGADGWSMFVHHPVSSANVFDLRNEIGLFQPDEETLGQPLKFFITAWKDPVRVLTEYRVIAGETPMPPKWALGYMQSHRTLETPEQMLQVAYNFRARNLPADAVIYLGTGFTPSGWNRGHGSFEFNAEIFDDPPKIFSDLKDLNFNVVLHTYSPPQGLHGSSMDEVSSERTHIRNYWKDYHEPVFNMGVDGWWPDGGEPLSSESRVARYRMYWQGPLHSRPNVRPWNINRTGYSGVHRYGGWIWSGDPDSYWETLKTQIAVGLNHSVSLTPYWGSDTGGFLPSEELTGELYLRWLQFSVFTASMRGHGRAWHTRLPWGWNTGRLGPPEVDQFSDAFKDGHPNPEELKNALVEPIAREFLNLRYRLLPYNYTLTRETYETGLPPMRAMWLHYPDDSNAVSRGDQFMWGRDLLVAPVYTQGATERTLYLPEGLWYDYWTNETETGQREISRRVDLATLPLYVRAGAILPLDPVRQYTAQEVEQPTAFHIYSGKNGQYRWYRDDGRSQDYQQGEYSWTRLTWNDDARRLVIEPDPDGEGRAPEGTRIDFILLPDETIRTVQWDGRVKEISFADRSLSD